MPGRADEGYRPRHDSPAGGVCSKPPYTAEPHDLTKAPGAADNAGCSVSLVDAGGWDVGGPEEPAEVHAAPTMASPTASGMARLSTTPSIHQ